MERLVSRTPPKKKTSRHTHATMDATPFLLRTHARTLQRRSAGGDLLQQLGKGQALVGHPLLPGPRGGGVLKFVVGCGGGEMR